MKITAVGGYEAIGRNMTGVTLDETTIAIDNGIRLDTLQMYDTEPHELTKMGLKELVGMDVIPEMKRLKDVKCQVISHGHLDHIGALGINEPRVPIVTTPYATEIGRSEFKSGDFYSIDYRKEFEVSPKITVELVEITHSIPHSSVVVLHTTEGDVVYACDFRLDDHSQISRTDYKRLRELGKGNVRALIVESTRVRELGKTPSESVAREMLKDVIESIDKGLIVATTFSTHIERVQAILDEAEKSGRIPLILGRSLSTQIKLAERFGLIELPPGAEVLSRKKSISGVLKGIKNRDEYFLLATGHQGEENSALSRLTNGEFPFRFQKNDSVIFCASVIPTPINYASRYILEKKLKSFRVNIFYDVHVSGHAAREDHRKLLEIIRPEHIIPCHGGMVKRSAYAELASEEGYRINKDVHLLTNGTSIEI